MLNRSSETRRPCLISRLKKKIIYLAVPGLGCAMWTLSDGMQHLVPWPGIEPRPPALGAQSLSHWATREVPHPTLLSLGLFHRYLLPFCSVEVTCKAWHLSILPRAWTSSGLQSSIAHSHYLFKNYVPRKKNNVIRSFPSSSSTKQGRRG